MKETELLDWINEQISNNNGTIQSLSMTAQQYPLSETASQVWDRTRRDTEVLKDLERVVINWHSINPYRE